MNDPTPIAPLPWTQADETKAIYDANGDLVSFTQNAPFLMRLVFVYQNLIQIERLAAALGGETAARIARLARGAFNRERAKTEMSVQ